MDAYLVARIERSKARSLAHSLVAGTRRSDADYQAACELACEGRGIDPRSLAAEMTAARDRSAVRASVVIGALVPGAIRALARRHEDGGARA